MIVKLAALVSSATALTLFWFLVYADAHRDGAAIAPTPAVAYDLPSVQVLMGDTIHYPYRSADDGDSPWSRMIPETGATVFNTTTGETSTVAMLHQLQCLDLIRQDYIAKRRASSIGRHCLNYLRQSLLCHADPRLESVRTLKSPGIVDIATDYECKDWDAVYAAVRRTG